MSDEFKIEKNIPPPSRGGPGRKHKYPFREMEVGDSFFYRGLRGTIVSCANYFGKRNNAKFVTRKENDGFRIWRIE